MTVAHKKQSLKIFTELTGLEYLNFRILIYIYNIFVMLSHGESFIPNILANLEKPFKYGKYFKSTILNFVE